MMVARFVGRASTLSAHTQLHLQFPPPHCFLCQVEQRRLLDRLGMHIAPPRAHCGLRHPQTLSSPLSSPHPLPRPHSRFLPPLSPRSPL